MAFTNLDDLISRAEARLDPIEGDQMLPEVGDHDLVDGADHIRDAAVLIPIIPRETGPTALLTQRPDTMAAHPGQVAFPGGKVDQSDSGPIAAALREAQEEVGVDPENVRLVARSATYVTGSGFRITPVLGVLQSDFHPIPDPTEVADVFETPLSYLFDEKNYQIGEAFWKGRNRRYIDMSWQGFRIWGVTAGIISALNKTLYDELET